MQPDAAGRLRFAQTVRLAGTVDAAKRVLAILKQIRRPCAKRIAGAGVHPAIGHRTSLPLRPARDHLVRHFPPRPCARELQPCRPVPGMGRRTLPGPVAPRRLTGLDQVQVARIGIHDDRPRLLVRKRACHVLPPKLGRGHTCRRHRNRTRARRRPHRKRPEPEGRSLPVPARSRPSTRAPSQRCRPFDRLPPNRRPQPGGGRLTRTPN